MTNQAIMHLLPYILFGTFAVLLLIRIPISYCLGIASAICLILINVPLSVLGQRVFTALDSFAIMAIPLFVLAGNIMTEGGISRQLIGVSNSFLGSMRGGLAMAAVLACGFFAALSGSGPATVVAIGGMIYPEMVKMGYPKHQMAGLVTVAGGLGPIIPPSIIMVIYGTITNTSITDLFLAGFVCGGLMLVALLGMTFYQSRKNNWPVASEPFSWKKTLASIKSSIWALFMPIIVLGGIYGGIFTPTEAAAIAVVYSLVVSVWVYKNMRISEIPKVFLDSAIASSVVLFIMATSSIFSWLFAYSGITSTLIQGMKNAGMGYYTLLLLITIILLVFGFFLEGTATVLLLIPIFLPLALAVGINPVHLGLIVTITNVVGCMTPPVAVNIFACSTYSKLPVEEIGRGEMPYLLTMVVILFAIVFIPQLATWLPSVL